MTWNERLVRLRVPLGYAVGLSALVWAKPSPLSMALGLPLALLGEAVRFWAAGHLVKGAPALTYSGPYARTRNPLYLGTLLLGLGFALATGRWSLVTLFVLFFLAVYVPVMRVEARRLLEVHPEAYAAFEEVPLFLPRLTPGPGSGRRGFSWERFRANREYGAVLGSVTGAVYLWWRLAQPP